MEIGRWLMVLGLVSSVLCVVLYAVASRQVRATVWARWAFVVATVCAVGGFWRLMFLVSHYRFQYQYVYDYVSADLQGKFLYSATWAGQEGSFLLWAVWTGILGLFVIWKSGRWEARVMPFYVASLAFLFGILTWLSPYVMLTRGGANGYPLDMAWPPIDGNGLNPSLQNYWMAIHPPTIFLGFVGLAVPFAYALAALTWKDHSDYAARSLPWTGLAVAFLGIGLFMGGYWAYETQGWHGFWAWDPVENASLFPWLASLGLLHGLLVQRYRGGMARTNMVMAMLGWVMFIYGTFLTRSGVLSSFSVHAFSSLEKGALWLLIAMVALSALASLVLLAWRWKSIPRPAADAAPFSRDTALSVCVTLALVSSIVVAGGTSWPLISRWPLLHKVPFLAGLTAETGVRVEPIFYNVSGVVLLIPALLAMAIVPVLAWRKANSEQAMWRLMGPWFTAIALGFGVAWFVQHEAAIGFKADTPRLVVVIVSTLSLFATFVNVIALIKSIRGGLLVTGGWLAHVGIGLLMVGTIISNAYEKSTDMMLIEGADPVKTPYGYALQFEGWTHDGLSRDEVQKAWWRFEHAVKINVTPSEGHGKGFLAQAPVFYHRQLVMNQEEGAPQTMRWPHIHRELHRDFYIAIASDPKLVRPTATLRPGETASIGTPGLEMTQYSVRYKKIYTEGEMASGGVIGAEMELKTPDGKSIPIRPGIRIGSAEGGASQVNTEVPDLNGAVILEGGIDPSTQQATVAFELPDAPARWAVPVAITNKPAVNLVWLGVILMGIGSLLATVRRSLEAGKSQIAPAPGTVGTP
jgi:cytochrome c-type biogenesis protein CcmF